MRFSIHDSPPVEPENPDEVQAREEAMAERRAQECPNDTHPGCYINAEQPGDCPCFDRWENAIAAGLPTWGLFDPDTPGRGS